MKDEYSEYLAKHCPIFCGPHSKLTYYGIAIGPGWWPIVRMACEEIEKIVATQPDEQRSYISQTKQKFGGLRLHYEGANPTIDQIIKTAERAAWKTCEDCGSTTDVARRGHESGWVSTLCGACHSAATIDTSSS